MKVDIENNMARTRFEARVDGHTAFLDYDCQSGLLILLHAETPQPLQGRGIAGQLTRFAMDFAREYRLEVAPVCSYVRSWLSDHPQYLGQVAA